MFQRVPRRVARTRRAATRGRGQVKPIAGWYYSGRLPAFREKSGPNGFESRSNRLVGVAQTALGTAQRKLARTVPGQGDDAVPEEALAGSSG
jgi:hypothetical protein